MDYLRYGFKSWLGILPGWSWLAQHEHDLDDWHPTLEITRPGFRMTATIKDQSVIKEVARKVMK